MTYMKYFKIKRSYAVKAEDEAEAFRIIAADPNKYLDSEEVTRVEYKRTQQEGGWVNGVVSQITGSNAKR
jgi:hypothetical protein